MFHILHLGRSRYSCGGPVGRVGIGSRAEHQLVVGAGRGVVGDPTVLRPVPAVYHVLARAAAYRVVAGSAVDGVDVSATDEIVVAGPPGQDEFFEAPVLEPVRCPILEHIVYGLVNVVGCTRPVHDQHVRSVTAVGVVEPGTHSHRVVAAVGLDDAVARLRVHRHLVRPRAHFHLHALDVADVGQSPGRAVGVFIGGGQIQSDRDRAREVGIVGDPQVAGAGPTVDVVDEGRGAAVTAAPQGVVAAPADQGVGVGIVAPQVIVPAAAREAKALDGVKGDGVAELLADPPRRS